MRVLGFRAVSTNTCQSRQVPDPAVLGIGGKREWGYYKATLRLLWAPLNVRF